MKSLLSVLLVSLFALTTTTTTTVAQEVLNCSPVAKATGYLDDDDDEDRVHLCKEEDRWQVWAILSDAENGNDQVLVEEYWLHELTEEPIIHVGEFDITRPGLEFEISVPDEDGRLSFRQESVYSWFRNTIPPTPSNLTIVGNTIRFTLPIQAQHYQDRSVRLATHVLRVDTEGRARTVRSPYRATPVLVVTAELYNNPRMQRVAHRRIICNEETNECMHSLRFAPVGGQHRFELCHLIPLDDDGSMSCSIPYEFTVETTDR